MHAMLPITKQLRGYTFTLKHRRHRKWITYVAFLVLLTSLACLLLTMQLVMELPVPTHADDVINTTTSSDRFDWWSQWDNLTGFPSLIVPNLVHFIKFRQHALSFTEMIAILAAWCHQKPDRIIIHCDCDTLSGHYWTQVRHLKGLEVHRMKEPTHVFTKPLSPLFSVYHAGDVARIKVLQKYGGIALDLDSYIVQSLDQFRRFECSIGWPQGENIGCQVIVAHKDARFLHLYKESYRYYNGSSWYYNAGQLPTRILEILPHIVHRVPVKFGVDMMMIYRLYEDPVWTAWRSYYAVHLFAQHRTSTNQTKEFNEDNIRTYSYPFGDMARLVLFGKTDKIVDGNNNNSDLKLNRCRP